MVIYRLSLAALLLPAVTACAAGVQRSQPDVSPSELAALEAQRAKNPQDHELLTRIGISYYRAKDYSKAAEVLRSAATLRPSFASVVYLGLVK